MCIGPFCGMVQATLPDKEDAMPIDQDYTTHGPTRAEIDAMDGPVVVEFGTSWCGYCAAAQPLIADAFSKHPDVRHIKIEDGKGRPAGRSFGVKLWPTLIFMDRSKEVARVVRPGDSQEIARALARLKGGAGSGESKLPER